MTTSFRLTFALILFASLAVGCTPGKLASPIAPADSPRIMAFDAVGGQILWHTATATEDVVHLLGVIDDQLIAAGHRLYWISLKREEAGRLTRVWPDGSDKLGYGRCCGYPGRG